jgi:hypothetical protein
VRRARTVSDHLVGPIAVALPDEAGPVVANRGVSISSMAPVRIDPPLAPSPEREKAWTG